MFHPDMSGYEIQIIKTLALIKILLYFKDYDYPILKIKSYIIVILKNKVFFFPKNLFCSKMFYFYLNDILIMICTLSKTDIV